MDVRVRFFGNYRRLADSSQTVLKLASRATPIDVVRALGERYGESLRCALISEDEGFRRLRPGIRIAVGDEVIDCATDLDRPLYAIAPGPHETEIQVFIFPSLSGGACCGRRKAVDT